MAAQIGGHPSQLNIANRPIRTGRRGIDAAELGHCAFHLAIVSG